MTMAEVRPKLIVVQGSDSELEMLRSLLGDRVEVIASEQPVDGGEGVADAALVRFDGELPARSLLLDSMADALCLARRDGTPALSNRAFAQLDMVVRERVLSACAEASKLFSAGGSVGGGVLQRKVDVTDGEASAVTRTFEVVITPVNDSELGTVVALVRDVTVARRLNQKMEAIDQAGSALVRLDAESVRGLNAVERLGVLEEKIIKNFRELLDYDHFGIRILDEKTGRLEMVMSSGFPQSAIELELYPALEGSGICGYVAATGRAYVCYDTARDDRYLPGASNAKSSLTVPLRIHDKVIGVLDIESVSVGSFVEEDRRFATIFARYIAIALQMLDMLVVERSATSSVVGGRFEGELSAPLEDILAEAEKLTSLAAPDSETARHIARIKSDVEAIRSRMKSVASGPESVLGLDRICEVDKPDPHIVGKRVLVVDDSENIRRVVSDVLRRRGATVVSCESGTSAIGELGEGSEPFDLVISDIRLPDHNGYEIFAAAKERSERATVILMTGFGYDPHHSIVRASQHGLQSVLFKPFQASRLLDEVNAALSRGEEPDPEA